MSELARGKARAAIREEQGLSQLRVAADAEISIGTLVRIEKGFSVSERILRQVAEALGIEDWTDYAEPQMPIDAGAGK